LSWIGSRSDLGLGTLGLGTYQVPVPVPVLVPVETGRLGISDQIPVCHVAVVRFIKLISNQKLGSYYFSMTNVLVLGAAGVVGFGVCDAWIREGATVIAVDTNEAELNGLRDKLGINTGELVTIVGDCFSEVSARQVKAAVDALNKPLKHIVSAVGCSQPAPSGLTEPGAVSRLKETYDSVFFPNFIATSVFLESVRSVEGATFTVAGGPFTHHCPDKELYPVSFMGATFNHFGTILSANTKDSPCRGNTLCCHYAIGFPGEIESKLGPLLDKDFGPATDCRDWGKAFVRVAKGKERTGFICMHDPDEVKVFVESKEWIWFPDQHKYGPAP
jgi:hypothetical protein